MFDFLLKHVLSLAISVSTLYVPKVEWQKKLDSLPTQAERVAKIQLDGGWKAGIAVSAQTGLTHTYYQLPCVDTASNQVLVLLHGFNTDGSVFFNLKPLAEKMTLIAYNFPEETELYTGSLRDFELILDDFCATLDLDTVTILGNSLGGIIAAFYTAHTKNVHVDHLVLASTYIPGAGGDKGLRLRKMSDKLLPYPDYKLFYLLTLGGKLANGLKNDATNRDAPIGSLVIKRIGWYRQILSMLYWYDGVHDADRIHCPTLILHGGADRLIPRSETEAALKVLPDARIFTIEKAGHSLIFTQSGECSEEIRRLTSE